MDKQGTTVSDFKRSLWLLNCRESRIEAGRPIRKLMWYREREDGGVDEDVTKEMKKHAVFHLQGCLHSRECSECHQPGCQCTRLWTPAWQLLQTALGLVWPHSGWSVKSFPKASASSLFSCCCSQ